MARNVPPPFQSLLRIKIASLLSLTLVLAALFANPLIAFATGNYDDGSFITATNPLVSRANIDPSQNSGAFTYDVPINAPAGRNGIQPNLKLTYSSQSSQSTSPFGFGWSINIPYIERINKLGTDKLYNQDQAHTYFSSSLSGELLLVASTTPSGTSSSMTLVGGGSGSSEMLMSLDSAVVSTDKTSAKPSASTPADIDSATKPDGSPINSGPIELTKFRTANTKQYLVSLDRKKGKTVTAYRFYTSPIQYQNPKTGSWDEIDTRLVPSASGFQMYKNVYQAALNTDGTTHLLTFEHDGQELYVDISNASTTLLKNATQPTHLSADTLQRSLDDHTVVYPNLLGKGIDLEVKTLNDRLVKEVVINDISSLGDLSGKDYIEVPFTLTSNKPLTLSANNQTLGDVSLVSSTTATLTDDAGIASYILPPIATASVASTTDTNSTTTLSISIDIAYAKSATGTIALTKRIPVSFLKSAVYPVRTDATFTYAVGVGDGYVKNYPTSGGTWSATRSGSTGTAALPSATPVGAISDYVAGSASYMITRGFFPVDTSALGVTATITSATFYAYPYGRQVDDASSTYSYAQLVGTTTQSSTSTLSTGDFSKCAALDNAARWSDTKVTTTTPWGSAYVALPLNATGTANIAKTGTTMLGWREGHDLENVAPTGDDEFDFYSADGGTSTAPYLEVVTSAATSSYPSDLYTENATNPANINTATPNFSAVFHSATTSDTASYYQIQVTKNSQDWLTPIWDSGQTALSSSTPVNVRTPNITYAGSPLPIDGTKYYWRIRFWNQSGVALPYSITGDNFVMSFGTSDYMAKVENGDFTRYTYTSDNKWIAYDKNGWRYKFGNSSSTQLFNPSVPSETYRWMIEAITDPNGNSIAYSYATDSAQLYPSKINYTANGSSTGAFEIEFLRENRPDYGTSSAYGFSVGTKQRISEIQAKVNGSWERKYALAYATSTIGTRSLLASVTETGKDPQSGVTTTLPPTTFDYQQQTKGWTSVSWGPPADFRAGVEFGDVNGDSYIDAIQGFVYSGGTTYKTFLNNSTSSWPERSGWSPPMGFYDNSSSVPDKAVRVADVNGDLKPDLVQYLGGGPALTDARLGDGTTPWVQNLSWVPLWPIAYNSFSADTGGRIFDYNGDGLSDQINDASLQAGAAESVGTGWVYSSWTVPTLFSAGTQIGDVNGDGLPDLVRSNNRPCIPVNQTGVYLNNGRNGWTLDPTWGTPPVPFATDDCNSIPHVYEAVLTDINGDGLADIVYGDTGTRGTYINTGHGWTQDASWLLQMDFGTNGGDQGVRIFDFDGNGLPDVVRANTAQNDTYANLAVKPDLLVKVSTTKGGSIKASYDTAQHLRDTNGNLLNPKLPLTIDVVTQTVDDPSFGGAVSTTTFGYAGGEWNYNAFDDRRFAGFASTTKTNSLGHTVRTSYHQGNSSDSTNGEYNDHTSKIGKPYLTEVLDGTSTSAILYSRTINKWARADFGDGRNFVKLISSLTQTFDGDSTHRDTAVDTTYDDATGNVLERDNWGEVLGNTDGTFTDTGSDKASSTYSYAASTTNTVMSLPARELVVDQLGSTVRDTKWTYDGLSFGSVSKGNQTKEEKLKSGSSYASTTKTFNSYGLVTQATDGRGGTTTYVYDTYNLYPATTTNALGQTQTFSYDYSSGKVATTTDANNRTFATDYDGLDRPIREKQPDFTTPTTLVLKTDYAYTDSTSTPSSVLRRDYLTSGTSSDLYAYLDGLGRTIQTRKEAEAASTFTVADTIYNNIGQTGQQSIPYFSTGTTWTSPTTTPYLYTTFAYDPAGRVQTIADIFGTTTSRYSDWFTRVTDPLGNYKDITKDAYGNLSAVGEELSSTSTATTTYTWNLNKNLTKITDASANVRNFTYDNLGRSLVSEDLHTSADTTFGTTTRTYDDAGNITQVINPRGQTINYAFDALNRPTSEDFTGLSGTEVQYFYDTCTNGKGRLCSVRKQGEATTTYAYNPIGLVTAEGKVIGLGPTQSTATTSFTAMRNGKDDTITYPDGALVSYIYDSAGLLDKVTNKESGGSAANVINRITWTPTEQIEAQDYANGVNSTSTYDQTKKYRLTNKFTKNSVVLQDIRYTYDAAGNITTLDEEASTSARKTINYSYDPLYRLLSASSMAVATGTAGYSQYFTYDALGNILSGPFGSYAYGQTGYANPDAVTALQGGTYTYDQSGNLTSTGSSTYAWDYNNRMASATVVTASTTVGSGGTSTATPTFVQGGINPVQGGTSNSITLSSSVAAGDLIVVGITVNNQTVASNAITDNKGNTYTKAAESINGADHAAVFYAKNVSGGSSFIVSANIGDNTLSAQEYSGVDTVSPLDKVATSTGTSTTPTSGNVTTTLNGELYFGLAWSRGHLDTWTAGSGYTKREEQLDDNMYERQATEDKVVNATTTDASFTTSSNNKYAAALVTFKPLVSTGGTSTATPTYIQSKLNTVQGSSTNFINFTNTVATGDLIVVGITVNNQTVASNAITDNKGNTYTKVAESINGLNHAAVFYAKNVTGGSNFRVTSGIGDNTLSAHEYSGVDTTSPLDKVATSTGTSATPSSGNVTTTLSGELYFGNAWSGGHLDTWTAGQGYTKREEQLDDNAYERQATEDKTVSTATTTSASFTTSSSAAWAANLVTFKPLVATSTSTGSSTTTYSTTTVTYLYDHNGDRVMMVDSTTTSYFGKFFQQTNGGYKKTKQLYANGVLIGTIEKTGAASAIPYYISSDNLGGASILTSASGTATQTLDYFPFGDIRTNSKNTSFDEPRKYIGQINDAATNLDYLNARYYDARRGQFTGQDPVARDLPLLQKTPTYILDTNIAAGMFDQTALLASPQLQNFYSYSANNPIIKSDPSGKCAEDGCVAEAGVAVISGIAFNVAGQAIRDVRYVQDTGKSPYASVGQEVKSYGSAVRDGALLGLVSVARRAQALIVGLATMAMSARDDLNSNRPVDVRSALTKGSIAAGSVMFMKYTVGNVGEITSQSTLSSLPVKQQITQDMLGTSAQGIVDVKQIDRSAGGGNNAPNKSTK